MNQQQIESFVTELNQYNNSDDAEQQIRQQNKTSVIAEEDIKQMLHYALTNAQHNAYQYLYNYLSKYESKVGLSINNIKIHVAADTGRTLLHCAAIGGNEAVCKELLLPDSPINPFVKDKDGCTAADYAYQAVIKNKEKQSVFQTFIDNHCAIGQVWLKLPEGINIKNKLMLGHFATLKKINNPQHIYDETSMREKKNNINEPGKKLILLRIKQYRISGTPELRYLADTINGIAKELGEEPLV
ncbi:MAG: ankyrin repeat domain-containing protein, partial [Gammaproteobacteria bacterium]